jgi:hypothetical protein
MAKVTYLKRTIRMLQRNNKALAFINGALITDNTLFYDKIRQMTRQVKQATSQVERLE